MQAPARYPTKIRIPLENSIFHAQYRLMKLACIFALIGCLPIAAQEPTKPTPSPAPEKADPKADIKKIDDHTFQIGQITINSKLRSISFPAKVEQNEVLIEYLVVNPIGKIHESIFTSDIDAQHLNIAFKLLSYQESNELIPMLDKEMRATGKYPKVAEDIKKKARFTINVSWEIDGKKVTSPIFQLVHNIDTKETLQQAPFIYSGSYLLEGKLKAQLMGDIIATFTDGGSIASYSGKNRENDSYWSANKQNLPPLGTPVTITFTPWKPAN